MTTLPDKSPLREMLAQGLLDVTFYSNEADLSFASPDSAASHFIETGYKEKLSLSPIFMTAWIMQQKSCLPEDFMPTFAALDGDTTIHPLLTLTWSDVSSPGFLSETLPEILTAPASELPIIEAFRKDLQEKWLSLPAASFLGLFSRKRFVSSFDCEWFSYNFYRASYADVRRSNANPFWHYVSSGWREGRDPAPGFSNDSYLRCHQDVAASGAIPLFHYLRHGWKEGREFSPSTNYEAVARTQSEQLSPPQPFVSFKPDSGNDLDELCQFMAGAKVIMVIPFYKNSHLVEGCLGSLCHVVDELNLLKIGILCVNDSPDDTELKSELEIWSSRVETLGGHLAIYENPHNKGFVYSSNIGLYVAEKCDSHCILLNSDTAVSRGALSEIVTVSELDDKFGFVNPRSNNATISTVGGEAAATEDWRDSYSTFERSMDAVPRYSIVPVVVGFCLFVNNAIIKLFGFLDSCYGRGYNEENDYIMRANRFGFISVIANHAFVAHIGKQSFSLLGDKAWQAERVNANVLNFRYPEYLAAVKKYFESSEYLAYKILTSAKNNFDVIIDIRAGSYTNNGTSKLASDLIPYLADELSELRIGLISSDMHIKKMFSRRRVNVAAAHEGDVAGLAIRFAQPFSYNDVKEVFLRGSKVGFFMLDAIALDCLYLQPSHLRKLWQVVFRSSDLLIFNSVYTHDKFLNRFDVGESAIRVATEHSYDYGEYFTSNRPSISRKEGPIRVLLFGNSFIHKALRPAFEILSILDIQLVVFGAEFPSTKAKCIPSGSLSNAQMEQLWKWCDVVVFPSLYEGFGFPVLEALSRDKFLIVHRNDRNVFMSDRLKKPFKMKFFTHFAEIATLISNIVLEQEVRSVESSKNDGWKRSAVEIAASIRATLERKDSFHDVRDRLDSLPTSEGS